MATLLQSVKHVTKHGLARTNRFNVIITLPTQLQEILNKKNGKDDDKEGNFLEDTIGEFGVNLVKAYLGSGVEVVRGLDIMCESAEFPGKSLSTSETKYNSDYINMPYGITYAPVTITFVVSRDFLEKNIIDRWQNLIIDPVTHDVGYFEEYVSPVIEIQQLNEQDKVTHKVQIVDAFPSEITSMALSNADSDTYHRMSVTFIYRAWNNDKIEQPTGVAALSETPLGPLVTPILGNPAVQKAMGFVEEQFDIDSLEGEAVEIYNQVDGIVRNTTGQSTNKSVGLLNGIKAQTDLNQFISSDQKAKVFELIDGTIGRLG